jgi:hypothetical protein
MKFYLPNSEKGQAIVYLVLGFVVFLGFVALAIDGGMALADRRHAQNAADAASLAGGGKAATILVNLECPAFFTCGNNIEQQAENVSIQRAGQNNFIIDNNLSDHNGVDAKCVYTEKYIDVTVDISSTTQSNFLQLVYPKALHNEVEAETRAYPGGPIGNNDAIVGLNDGNCSGGNGVTVNGTGSTVVNGGNIFSNGCVQGNGTKGSAEVSDGEIYAHFKDEGNITFTPTIQITSTILTLDDYYIEPPSCTVWYDKLPSGVLHGLYCMTGNLDFKPGDEGYGVTFYVPNGTISANGNGKNPIKLYAPSNKKDDPGYPPNPPAITGILFFSPNGKAITVNGDTGDVFSGVVYAPKSQVTVNGTADNIFFGQVIGWDVKIGGNNNMTVNYDLCNGYLRLPSLELYK